MPYDPYLGYPSMIEMIETFDDSSISTTRWDTTEVGSTVITESGGYLNITNLGAGVLGTSYVQSKNKYPRHLRVSVDMDLSVGYAAADGDHFESSLVFYKDADNWIRVGAYRDTSESINFAVYLRVCDEGSISVTDLGGVPCDASERVLTVVVLGDGAIMFYIDAIYVTSIDFPKFHGFYLRLEAGTTANADKGTVVFDDLEVHNYFDPIFINIARRIQQISDCVWIDDTEYIPGSGDITISDTTPQILEFTKNAYGTVFYLSLSFNITGARVDYCRLYDATGAGSFTNYDNQAKYLTSGSVCLVPSTGAGVGDCIYFGLSEDAKRLDVRIDTPDSDNTFEFEYWNGSAWASLADLSDGTVGFTTSGSITWSNSLGSVAVNGVTAYWTRARVTSAGAVVPKAHNVQFSPLVAADWNSIAAHGTKLYVEFFRKVGLAYSSMPSSYEIYEQCKIDQIVDIPGVRCYSDTKVVVRVENAPASAITIPYISNVVTEYIA